MSPVLLFILCFIPKLCYTHVMLTFPRGRSLPLDFLDTTRTSGPCGVPRPSSPQYTNLYTNQTYNITWRLQNPHQGGYRITLLDEKGEPVEQLMPTSGTGYAGDEDQTAQSQVVRITKACNHCTIQLLRQALEWGDSYSFHACSDVNVVDETPNDLQKCSENGDYENGKCVCKHLFSGDICQYKDDCTSDEDCLNNGKCVNEPTALVHKTCFCSFGFFGRNCDRTFDWKPDHDECFNYDYPINKTRFSKYGLFNEQCFKMTSVNEDDRIYSRVVADEVEIIVDYIGTTWVGVGWRPVDIDPSCRLFPDLEHLRRRRNPAESVSSDEDEPLQPVQAPKKPENNGFLERELQAPLHPMDCTDVIIGSVVDGRSRINDMYTRDRSTPIIDTLLDGEESFSAAYGIEQDGRTIIMFRRSIAEIEPSDHPLGPGELFVIYAKGQTSESFSHYPKSALETGNYSDHDFYKIDQLRYHGSKNRGVKRIEFVTLKERPQTVRPQLHHRIQSTVSDSIFQPETEMNSHSTSVPKGEPQPGTNASPEPEATQVVEPGLQLEPLAEPEPGSQPEPSAGPEPGPQPEPSAEPEPGSRPEPSPESEGRETLEDVSKEDPLAEPEPEPQPEPNNPASSNEMSAASDGTHGEHKTSKYDSSLHLGSSASKPFTTSVILIAALIYVL
ncbi:unnamed protein product [Anisakis simplex]|uniref:EGF-like domain-containing protein n=1 Tax=Anisakis simplex TaxID=6269 RepID=A0A0M3IY17_ANISI|nr:unnamed protein product [Anisakis simplex]